MANTFTQIHIQLVFAVKYRQALIDDSWRSNLHAFTTNLLQEPGHKMLQINSRPDHIHIFYGMRPHEAISTLVKNIKSLSSRWINDHHFCKKKFQWQEGYGAFSYSKSQVDRVIRYIQNQEMIHRRRSFLKEYTSILDQLNIAYDPNHIFHLPK